MPVIYKTMKLHRMNKIDCMAEESECIVFWKKKYSVIVTSF